MLRISDGPSWLTALAAPPPQGAVVMMTPEEREEAELQTWSPEWARWERSRLELKAQVLAAAALEPTGADFMPAPSDVVE